MHGNEESPEEDHDRHVFRDWEALEGNCVRDLGNQDAEIEESGEIVELVIREVVVLEETEDGRSRKSVFVHELDYVGVRKRVKGEYNFEYDVRV